MGTAVPLPKRGRSPQIFGPCLLWPSVRIDQDGTWHGGGSWSRTHCARWGPSSPSQKEAEPPSFGPFLLWLNGWMHQHATWYGGRPQPSRLCVKLVPSLPPQNGPSPNFRPTPIVVKRLYGSRCRFPLGKEVGLGLRDSVTWGPSSPSPKGAQPPVFGQCPLWPNGWMD